MNITMLNRVIRQLCITVEEMKCYSTDWTRSSEEMLFYETAVCTFGSQMLFELAVAMADRLKQQGLLQKQAALKKDYIEHLKEAFLKPVELSINNTTRKVSPRFRNRLPSSIASTASNIYGSGSSIKAILDSASSAVHARQMLIRSIVGFGPKQASLFLRRIGFCSELAVLDTHILDYLRLSNGLDVKPNRLSSIKVYEGVEAEFKQISADFGYSVGCVDLATWVTMRVAKREYLS